MKIKNTSDAVINLKSGVLKPGDEGDATVPECKVLFNSNKAEVAIEPAPAPAPAPKVAPKPKAKANG